MKRRLGAAAFLFPFLFSAPAFAHSAERGFVLLLPTSFIIWGGAAAVAISFLVLAFSRGEKSSVAALSSAAPSSACACAATSFVSFLILAALLALGLYGPSDPLENLLPLTIWLVWWTIVPLLHPLVGNLWRWINPLAWLCRFAKGPARLAEPLALWLSPLLFLAFAFFQLIHPSPEDPGVLATAVIAYLLFTVIAVFLFGGGLWFAKGDPFAVLFRLLARFSPFSRESATVPPALATSLLVVLALSSISFDALAPSFWWLTLNGFNPLEFPGRTAVIGVNSVGLILASFLLLALIASALWLGQRLAGAKLPFRPLLGSFAVAFLPISIAFHLSHYLTYLLVNGQYLLGALNDPLGQGWQLLGLKDFRVTTSFLNTAPGAWTLFAVQSGVIVLGHIASVWVAHRVVLKAGLTGKAAIRLELPMAALMVLFTAFGLWCLSTPTGY